MAETANIVQVEFFQVNIAANSLESFMDDAHSRIADGDSLKLTLRFHDTYGDVTAIALKLKSLEKWKRRLEICVAAKTGWRQSVASSMHQTVMKWIRHTRNTCVLQAAEQLRLTIVSSQEVAREEADHSFRLLYSDEVYETLTAVEKSKAAILIIFKPNDLIAEHNESVASVL